MGGDHKCPVCEATFTRPQHVARHMRSHTGDRPYKCQYCGDQFARSDLLSRHVNKCHANEKPSPSTGVRRKGSASASRATTSKQVCDQCVQANTSCDGCNPCTKCVQRKYRCTFVKFHRQTAPAGPGHTVRPGSSSGPPSPNSVTTTASSSSRVSIYHQQPPEDDFILGPPPTVVPTMAETLYGATPFTFPPLYPTNNISGDNTDYVAKYRAHAELFGPARSGSTLNSTTTGLSPNIYDSRPPSSWLGWGQQDISDPYHHQHRHPDLISDSVHPPPPHVASSSMNDKDLQVELAHHHHHQQQHQQHSDPNHYMNLSVPYSVPLSTSNYLLSDPNNNSGNNGNAMGGESADIIDFHGSDSASHSSCSVPSSAASSSVHLPLAGAGTVVDNILARKRGSLLAGGGGGYDNNGALLIPDRAGTASSSSSSSSQNHRQDQTAFQSKQVPFSTHDQHAFSPNQHQQQQQHQHHHHHPQQHQHQSHPHHHHLQQQIIPAEDNLGRPGFSSAFGLLSIDDPNVLAGISTDGAPFFDDPSQAHNHAPNTTSGSTTTVDSDVVQLGNTTNMDTPMPIRRDSGQLQLLSLEGSSGQRFPVPSTPSSATVVENGSSPSKEKDSKELKEFWKQYMRLPLSGSGMSSVSADDATPIGNGHGKNVFGSGPGYRRPRVASLPAVKTPVVERDGDNLNLEFSMYQNHLVPPSTSALSVEGGHGSTRRPTREIPGMAAGGMDVYMGMNMEDLRSYEAAVMARKAPTTLNLKRPMRGRGRGGGTCGKSREGGNASESGPHPPGCGGGDTTVSESSLYHANTFGPGPRPSHSRDQTLLPGPGSVPPHPSAMFGRVPFVGRTRMDPIKKEESSSPSLSPPTSSSLSADFEGEVEVEVEDNTIQPSDMGGVEVAGPSPLMGNMSRPSFKRLPSQTLGPDNSKRPFYGFEGGEGGEEEESIEGRSVGGWGSGGTSIAERRMRKRRMSEPSTISGVGNFELENQNGKMSLGDGSAVQSVDMH